MNNNCGIYKIENKYNGNFYIGQSTNILERISAHKRLLRTNKSHNPHLQSAWNKYGEDNFEFSVVMYSNKEFLDFFEQRCVDILHPKYNIRKDCKTNRGFHHSELSKQKIKNSQIGKIISDETRRKLSMARIGRKLSDETKKKISKSLMGHTNNLGRRQTQDEKDKRGRALKSHWKNHKKLVTQVTKDKLSKSISNFYSRTSQYSNSKISKDDVLEIRRRRGLGETCRSLGKEFGLSENMISRIGTRKAWKHV